VEGKAVSIPRGKLLLVASPGGHIAELDMIAPLLGASADSVWLTSESEQTRMLVGSRPHVFTRYVKPRDAVGVLAVTSDIRRLLAASRFDGAVSTGAALAVPALILARLRGLKAVYIESVCRVDGPSLTGRILARIPGIDCYTQYPSNVGPGWAYAVSLFERFDAYAEAATQPAETPAPTDRPTRLFVTLGTIKPYRFDSIVDRVRDLVSGTDTEVVWQLGSTDRVDLPGEVHGLVSGAKFDELATGADRVITHAGVGSCLRLLQLGLRPLVVPRRAARAEHVDDHQEQIARELGGRLLVDVAEAPEITVEDLAPRPRRSRVS
jgi:UDP-N-acetylglucosamine--N-acetylmuramyl-(pentapeptide) pyrophosphoryl-undecaprenol N-acetylglucosamine transferase